MKRLLALLLCLMPLLTSAQFFKVDYEKKIIYTDSLNLPDNSTANSVLYLLPELLQRPGTSISMYDIKVNDMSLGSSADAALIQLRLFDVEKIEVNESPSSSYQNNGQGGSINIILRDQSQIQNSRHPDIFGTLGMSGAYPLDLTPSLHLGYKHDKFTLHTLAIGEWYNYGEDKAVHIVTPQGFNTDANMDLSNHFYSQMVRLYTKYAPTDNDLLKFNLSESSTANRTETTQNNPVETYQNDRTSSTTLQTLINYKHVFRPHCQIETELQYIYNPGRNTYYDPAVCDYLDRMRTHNVSGKVEFKTPLVPQYDLPDPNNRHFADIKLGLRANGVFLGENIANEDLRPDSKTGTIAYDDPTDNSFFLMPYAELEAGLGKFRFKAIGEYQHYEYHIHQNMDYDHNMDDFTGKLMLEWHFTQDHQLRLIFDRQIIRPIDSQIYPYMRYSPTNMCYVLGTDLPVSGVQEVKLDYVGYIRMAHKQGLMLNVAVSYNNVSDISQSYKVGGESAGGGMFGQTQAYYTFNHDGHNKLINADLMARYTYKAFSLAFTGNLTHLFNDTGTGTDEYTYYNLSITPSFKFPMGWSASLNARYFSRIMRNTLRSGDYGLLSMRIGKDFGPVNVSLYGSIAPGGKVNDITYGTDSYTITSYSCQTNSIGMGVHWKF